MSISITLPDDCEAHVLQAAAIFFQTLADVRSDEWGEPKRVAAPAAQLAPPPVIAPEDNPEHGVEPAVTAPITPATAFSAPPVPPVPEAPTDINAAAAAFAAPPPPTVTLAGATQHLPQAEDSPSVGPAGQQLDKTGLPWDKRIHSDGANKLNADGTWRKRRGLNDPALVARVEAELRAAMAAPAVPAAPPVPQVPTLTVVPSVPQVAQSAEAQPGASASTPSPAGSAPLTFVQMAPMLSPLLSSKVVTTEHINAALAAFGMPPGLPILASRPDLVAPVFAKIKELAGVQ